MHSIKTKLIVGLSILVIFLFSVTAVLLIGEKQRELSRDIYIKARAFSELTTPKITDLYKTLLKEKSFVLFNREIKDIFNKNEDVSQIRLYSFAGEIFYDSSVERDRAYDGPIRFANEPALLKRIKTSFPSYALKNGRIVFLKKDADGNYVTIDENEKSAPEIEDTDEIINILYPFEGKFSIEFEVTYKNLRERVVRTTERIVFLLIFGILLGLGFGWLFAGRITTPIEKLTAGALILAKGDFKARVRVETRDEVGTLSETFNKMAHDLEISTKALVYKERVAKELEVAAKMQKEILPDKLPQIEGLDLAACVIPAVEIGGDCYDFIQVDPQTHLFYISDVTGHGVPSGIVVSIANALIYSYAHSPSLKDILINVNRVLKQKTASNMFMTLLMLRYSNGELTYLSAGHPEMLHYSHADKKVVQEKGGGIALGMMPDISKLLNEASITFNSGDCIVLYSDGIPEALSPSGEQYGMQRFKRALSEHGEFDSSESIKNALIADVKAFIGGAVQADDITLVIARRRT